MLDATGFNQAGKSTDMLGASFKGLENIAKNAAGAIAGYFAFSSFKEGIKGALDYAESINHVRQAAGMSADQVYALSAQAKLADVSFESVQKSTAKFNKNLGEASMGTGDARKAFQNLGLSLKDNDGHMIGAYEQMGKISDRFKDMPDGASKTTLAMQLFGKSGASMIPILNQGSDALSEYAGIMDNKTAAAAENFNDSMTRIGMTSDTLYMQMTASLAPTLNAIANDFNGVAKAGQKTGHTLGADLAEGVKVAINLGYGVAASFSIAGHALGNFYAAASMLAEGDFKGAKFAWNTISKDFNADIDSWGTRMANVKNAKPEDVQEQTGNTKKFDSGLHDRDSEASKAKSAEAAANKIKNAYTSMYADLYKISHNDYENEIRQIEDKAKKYSQDGIKQVDVEKFTQQSKIDLKKKYEDKANEEALAAIKKYDEEQAKLEFEANEQAKEAIKTYNAGLLTAQIDTFTAMGDTTSAYYLQEEEKMKKLAETGWYTNEQMLIIKSKDNEKFQKEQWDRDHKFWADTFVNINKAMDDQFFNAMSGKFTNFGNWLKDFWGSITQSMTRGLSKSLADTIMGTGNNSDGGIANWFKSYGGFSGVMGGSAIPAALAGATTSGGLTTTVGGTVIDSAGKIVTSGSDASAVMDAVNVASTANTAYSLFTSGVTAAMYAPSAMMGQLAGTAYGAGLTGTGSFLAGGANVLAGGGVTGLSGAAYAGGLATAGIAGGLGGYALGSIGDKLLGADTRAANYGAIGGATGAIVGSVVPVIGTAIGAVVGAALGSLIGGAFGKTKTSMTGSGVQFWEEGSASNINASSYADMMSKTKSWFKSSERYWTEYAAISDSDKLKIKKTFDVYNYLLSQLDKASDVTIAAGKYAGSSFQDAMAKGFITKFTNINTSSPEFAKIYSYWTTYASEVSKTVAEALTTSVGEYITTTRSFNEWKLGSGSVDQLKFTADYLAKDFNILSDSMGVSGLTVENYLQKYDEAIKTSFSPETITTWKNLGNALMSATDANSKYVDSLKNVQNQLLPQDMNLSKGTDASQIYQTITTQNDTLKYSFAEMISVLRNILYNQQFNGLNVGIPA